MKKNRMMRLASALLVAVLLTTCAISGTFAKYVTSADAEDSARVAKWGVVIETTSDNAFAPTYASDTTGVSGNTVVSDYDEDADGDKDDVLAPGTSGHLGKVTITGKPEVVVDVAVTADLEISNNWKVDDVEYFPIVFTIDGETYGTNDTNATHKSATIADLIDAVEGVIEMYGTQVDANTDLAVPGAYDFDISWEWPFEVAGDLNGDGVLDNDYKDTKLGDKAVSDDLTIEFSYSATVTQVD